MEMYSPLTHKAPPHIKPEKAPSLHRDVKWSFICISILKLLTVFAYSVLLSFKTNIHAGQSEASDISFIWHHIQVKGLAQVLNATILLIPEFKLTTFWSQAQRPTHWATHHPISKHVTTKHISYMCCESPHLWGLSPWLTSVSRGNCIAPSSRAREGPADMRGYEGGTTEMSVSEVTHGRWEASTIINEGWASIMAQGDGNGCLNLSSPLHMEAQSHTLQKSRPWLQFCDCTFSEKLFFFQTKENLFNFYVPVPLSATSISQIQLWSHWN